MIVIRHAHTVLKVAIRKAQIFATQQIIALESFWFWDICFQK